MYGYVARIHLSTTYLVLASHRHERDDSVVPRAVAVAGLLDWLGRHDYIVLFIEIVLGLLKIL